MRHTITENLPAGLQRAFGDIQSAALFYRADDRALSSINREIFAQQQSLAGKIRQFRPQIVLAPRPGASADACDPSNRDELAPSMETIQE